MIIDIIQTKAVGGQEFEVIVDGVLKYTSVNPWFGLSVPLGLDEIRKSGLYDMQKNKVFHTEYDISANLIQKALPLKYLIGIEQKNHIFSIIDKNGTNCGGFYHALSGMLAGKYIIGYGDEIFNGYEKASGKMQNVSIYFGENQVAQIVKGFAVENMLDKYKLYIKKGYEHMLEILSFFTIFYDRVTYSKNGQIYYKGSAIHTKYTWDKYNKYYNPNWIIDTFGENEYNKLKTEIKNEREKVGEKLRKWLPFFWIGMGLLAISVGILIYSLINNS